MHPLAERPRLAAQGGGADPGKSSTRSSRATASTRTPIVGDLSIARRQMVEIARAFSVGDRPVKLVILDEPTSSLDAILAGQLLAYVRKFVAEGGAVVLISHLLGEILSTADRIVVMRDGKVVAEREASAFTRVSLVESMGSVASRTRSAQLLRRSATIGEPLVVGRPSAAGRRHAAHGASRRDRRACRPRRPRPDRHAGPHLRRRVAKDCRASTVAGSRSRSSPATGRRDGIFPLWSIADNTTIASLPRMTRRLLIDPAAEARHGRGLAPAHRHPHGRRRQPDPVAVRRQPAEGAVCARAGLGRRDHPDGRSDARRRHRHQAGSLWDAPRRGREGPHLPVVHHRDGRAEALRPCLCFPRRPHRAQLWRRAN